MRILSIFFLYLPPPKNQIVPCLHGMNKCASYSKLSCFLQIYTDEAPHHTLQLYSNSTPSFLLGEVLYVVNVMQSTSLPDRNFNNRVYEADTNSKNPIDSFHFKTIGMTPSLLSRMVDRASIDSSGETSFVDQQQSMDTSQADSSEALGSSAKSLLARLGLNVDTMPLNGLSADTDALIDVHAQQNPEYSFLPSDNTGGNKSSVLKANATTSENTRSQPASESSTVASTNADGIVVTPIRNNDFTRSPTLVSDGKDDLVESGSKESRSCELTVTYITPERGSGLSLEENVSASPVVRDLSTHDNGDQSILTYSITGDRTQSADVTSTLTRLPSTESTRFQPIHSDLLSLGHQSIAPFLSSVYIPRQPSPDPFKRMFASVFDEATAAWEEEARHRETLGPPQRSQMERAVVQGASTPKDTPENQRSSRRPNPSANSTSSHSSGKERLSNPGPQESFPIHGDPQTVLHPVGHASAPLTDISTVTIPPSSKTCVASLRAVTGAPIVSHPNISTADSTASSSCILQAADSRHITHGQKEDLEYVNVVSTSQTNVDVKPAAIQTLLDGSTNEALPSNVPTGLNLHTATLSAASVLAENPSSGKRSDLKSVVGGVILDARQLHDQSSASNITPLAERPPQIREVIVQRPSPQQTVPPVATAEDDCQSQGQSTKLPTSDHFEPDGKDHSMKGSVLPPENVNLVYSKKDSPVSRPLKRRLSPSPTVKREEDSASYISTASKMANAFLRPSKIKKIEDDDEKPLLKVEPREDKLVTGLNGRKNASPAVSGTQNFPHVEEKHDQLIRGISPMSFRYPSDPPQPLTTQPIISTTVEGNSSKHELVNIASSSIAPSGEESAAGSKRSLLIPPATPIYPEWSCRPEIDARVGQERSIPTRELYTSSGSEVPVDHGRNTSRTRYLRDVRRSPPRRARSPIHHVDHYSSLPAPRYAPSDRYVWDGRRRSMSPGRSLSPRRRDPRYVDSRYPEYVLRRSRSPPPYNWARNPPSSQERFADPIALGHHSFSARALESRPNVFYRDLEERRYHYEASTDSFINANEPGPENPRQRGRSPDIDHNGPSSRNRNSNAMSPPTTVGQLASHPPHQPEIHEQVSAPVQVSSSLISRMEGKAQIFNANAPRLGPKRKTSVTHALPPKPGSRTPSDGANTDKLHVKPVSAVQFSDRIEPLSHSRTTEKRTSSEDKKLTAQLDQARYRLADPQGAASSAHLEPHTSHPQAKNSPSLLRRIDAPTTVTRNKGLPPHSRAVLNLETEGLAKVRQTFPKVKMQSGPSSPGGSGRRNVPRPIPQQDKPDVKRRISNSSQSPSSSPVTREFNAYEQQGNLLNRISQLESAPASNRGNHNNRRSFPPSPRIRQNSQHIHNNSTAPQPPYRVPEPLSPSPGDKLARRIK